MQADSEARPRAPWSVSVACLFLFCIAGKVSTQSTTAPGEPSTPGVRSSGLSIPAHGKTGFTLLSSERTSIDFTNHLSMDRSITNHVLLNGSGVTAGDVDQDGLVDLYFCGLDGPNRLYKNLGDWRFTDITHAELACESADSTGAAFADLDGDGDLDLLVNSISAGTRVFLNDGKGRFASSPKSPLLNPGQAGVSMALADVNGDGALDLYIANYRPMFFFLDKPETRYSVRMMEGSPKVTMIDGRPLTDPEFTNRFVFQVHVAEGKVTLAKEEVGQVDAFYLNDGRGGFTEVAFTGGAFQDEGERPLTEPPRDWGLSVMMRDLNGDGSPDIYVCNDFRTPDRIWMNDGRGKFRALPRRAIRATCLSAMGLDVADVNRDGWFDIFVADMLSTEHGKRLTQRIDLRPEVLEVGEIENRPQFSRNMLHLSRGDGTFAEIAQFCGLQASEWTWSPIFLDVDLDGYEDLLVSNGFERDTMNLDWQKQFESMSHQQKLTGIHRLRLRRFCPRLDTPNLAFRNLGNGTFTNVSAAWGFATRDISQGTCLADLDNDGDLDVAVNCMNGPAGLYRNETVAPRIAVRLKGNPPNTRGIGARIEVLGGPVYQSQEIICGGRYCSSDDATRTFAAGASTNSLTLVVTWRNGRRSVVEGATANRLYEIDEAAAGAPVVPYPPPAITLASAHGTNRPWLYALPNGLGQSEPARASSSARSPVFRDVSSLVNHVHHEEPFDDFERQPLLPVKLSQSGPGISWFDLDGDGWEDLAIGSGRGGKLAVYRNQDGKAFRPWTIPVAATRDQTAIVGWHPGPGKAGLLVGASSYEDGQTSPAAVHRIDFPGPSFGDAIPGNASSTGPILLGDTDSDGDLDLFVGSRVIPGRFPIAGSSRLFLNDGGAFRPDPANALVFDQVGLVTGGVFSDLDADGDPDLVLACDWGSVRVFTNQAGKFIDATAALGLASLKGWWNGVNVGDFDSDGRLDIVASNWGRNSKYEITRAAPSRLVYGDFNGDGGVQLLEAYFDMPADQRAAVGFNAPAGAGGLGPPFPGGKLVPWRRLDMASKAMPFLNASFATFESFSRANLQEILGDRAIKAQSHDANWLESTLFLNRGNRFQPSVLPLEAQMSPAFAVCVGDLDADGAEDIFLSQNFFAVPAEMSRYDAGRGLSLRGDGRGGFQAVSGAESGLLIYGEQRGAALCDYNADGRTDLLVTQNGAATKLFQNQSTGSGLRVRLRGPPLNPEAIGAQLRLVFADRKGPVREVHGGAGYWSQDGAVQVLAGGASIASAVEVRWPGGKTVVVKIPDPAAREIEIAPSGEVRTVR